MGALSNPFDVLPANLFNLLGSQAGELQRHYMAILLRIYEAAEFNRFGLTREVVVGEIVNYRRFGFGNVPGKYSSHSFPFLVDLEHDLRCLLVVFVENYLKDQDHKIHSCIIVVEQQDFVHRWLFDFLAGTGYDQPLVISMCVAHY